MALTPQIRSPQGVTIPVFRAVSDQMRLTAGTLMVVYNIPAEQVRAAQAAVLTVFKGELQINVTQANNIAVYRGVIDNPKLRSWSFSLDTHDMYVLKLGTGRKTLVYDLTTQQWSYWSSESQPRWRASVGLNWRSSGAIPANYGTNIVVGDDSSGVLWVLDPERGYDESVATTRQVPFERVATGQMVVEGRQATPVFSTYLSASVGSPSLVANTVSLEYSDNQGRTYITADQPQVSTLGDYNQDFVWRSLGQVRSPGRLFRITDNGAFARIDKLDVNI